MSYLMIQNAGVAPAEAYTMLGVSTTRDCGVEGTIGQFGSGTKHAINVLLRAGLKFFIYCGPTKLEFFTKDESVNDGLVSKTVQRVCVKFSGTSQKTLDLSWVVDFGSLDWTEIAMALREFVSNALDRTIRENHGEFGPSIVSGDLAVCIVEEAKIKAKAGFTRVFIEASDDVYRYFGELPRRFLHFSNHPEHVRQTILLKANRNLGESKTPMVYRCGVFVREIQGEKETSLYDYNFAAKDITIDESRNSSDYSVRAACAKALRSASADQLVPFLRSLTAMESSFESGLDPYYLCSNCYEPSAKEKGNWSAAWTAVAGDAVLCGSHATVDFVARKGFTAKPILAQNLVEPLGRLGIKTDTQVLTSSEKKGHDKIEATPAAQAAVNRVWGWIENCHMTNGRAKPYVGSFRAIQSADAKLNGFCDEDGVFLEESHASGLTKDVLQTALEECIHWCTGSGDKSRDLQEFAFRMIVEMAL